MGLNEGMEAARMPTLVSMTDQYMGFAIAVVGSVDTSIEGTKVMRTMDEMHALYEVRRSQGRETEVVGRHTKTPS